MFHNIACLFFTSFKKFSLLRCLQFAQRNIERILQHLVVLSLWFASTASCNVSMHIAIVLRLHPHDAMQYLGLNGKLKYMVKEDDTRVSSFSFKVSTIMLWSRLIER